MLNISRIFGASQHGSLGIRSRSYVQSHAATASGESGPVGSEPAHSHVAAATPSSPGRIPAKMPPISHPPLSLMPTDLLLRSYFMTRILASPRLLRLAMPLLTHIANSSSILLNPDKNPILHVLIRKLIYDHFNAGECEEDVRATVKQMKALGFKGVILGYAKEVNVSSGARGVEAAGEARIDVDELAVREWKEGTLKTLSLIGEGDFLAVK